MKNNYNIKIPFKEKLFFTFKCLEVFHCHSHDCRYTHMNAKRSTIASRMAVIHCLPFPFLADIRDTRAMCTSTLLFTLLSLLSPGRLSLPATKYTKSTWFWAKLRGQERHLLRMEWAGLSIPPQAIFFSDSRGREKKSDSEHNGLLHPSHERHCSGLTSSLTCP